MRRYLLLCALLASTVFGDDVKVTAHTLANGMKVLVHEDHDVPNVALYFFYRIGSRNERPGATGISHFFEHMMFNGAKKYGPKQFDIEMEKAGGNNNAYTSRDVTVYTDWFPRSALPLMFDMEADRIRDLAFDPKIIESERGVVYSERRTAVDNNPVGALYEQLSAATFIAHPYHWPVIGWASDIEAWTMDDLKAHFKTGYAPNNCVMVVTGDVSDAEIMALAKKYIEPIPSQPPPPPVRTVEPAQLGERRVVVRRPAELVTIFAAYHVPATRDADSPALELLDNILTSGRSSRLHSRLVEKDQLALSVGSGTQRALDPSEFIIQLQVRSGRSAADAEKALYEELARLAKDGVTAEELNKARNQALAAFYKDLKTIAGKANLLGNYEVFHGGWERVNQVAAELDKVQPADIQRIAAKYLSENNRTVATLIPDNRPQEASK